MTYHNNIKRIHYPYRELDDLNLLPRELVIADHKGGFDKNFYNPILAKLNKYAVEHGFQFTIYTWEYYTPEIKALYTNLKFVMSMELFHAHNGLTKFIDYTQCKDLCFEKFLCTFNGTGQPSRILLVSALNKLGMFDVDTCGKNFTIEPGQVDGVIDVHVPDQHRFYRKFFVDTETDFNNLIVKFGSYGEWTDKFNWTNIYPATNDVIARCFVNLVSESAATSYYPFVTEKFLLSVISRGLFVAYAQPGYHTHLDNLYGFKPYAKLFDYSFDSITNPVDRLINLLSMLSKFQNLKTYDWHDLHQLEIDTINYNYDHYFSGDYLKNIEKQLLWP